MVSTPAELRIWRAEAEATQDAMAEVLGVTSRSVAGWEAGEHMIPSLLSWALLAAKPHVESLVAYNRRKDTANRKRRERKRRERRNRTLAAARRAVKLEAMRERRKEVEAQQKLERKETSDFFRTAERYVAQQMRAGKIRPPDAPPLSIIKPPRPRIAQGRKIRSDLGGTHKFRGEPGKRLQPEDIAHEA